MNLFISLEENAKLLPCKCVSISHKKGNGDIYIYASTFILPPTRRLSKRARERTLGKGDQKLVFTRTLQLERNSKRTVKLCSLVTFSPRVGTRIPSLCLYFPLTHNLVRYCYFQSYRNVVFDAQQS